MAAPSRELAVLVTSQGWITPGTNEYLRVEQLDKHLAFLREKVTPFTRHMILCHCGWWLDDGLRGDVLDLTATNPEPNRAMRPAGRAALRALAKYVAAGRLDFFIYPYAANVAEATTGEAMLRSLRAARDLNRQKLGVKPRLMAIHDYFYSLDWGAAQMPQMAAILGFDAILANAEGAVRAPDGTVVRLVGAAKTTSELLLGQADPRRPHLFAQELHGSLETARMIGDPNSPLTRDGVVDLKAVRLDDYLKLAPRKPIHDSRVMGSKGWYGGAIDTLLMEQNAKTVDLRLPAIEAVAVMMGTINRTTLEQINRLWKMSWILMDNHTLWQCHNYKAHYLPRSFAVKAQMEATEQALVAPRRRSDQPSKAAVFNPVPWKRDAVVTVGKTSVVARNLPGWSVSTIDTRAAAARRVPDRNTTTLANGRVRYTLNTRGEVTACERHGKRGIEREAFAGLGSLVRICEQPDGTEHQLRTGERLDVEGAVSLETVVDNLNPRGWRTSFEMADLVGTAFLVQMDGLDNAGRTIFTRYDRPISLHWGGNGMPSRANPIAPCSFATQGATRLKLTIWMVAEGCVQPGEARVWFHATPNQRVDISRWTARVHYRNRYVQPEGVTARVVRSDAAIKTVRFTGRLPDLRYTMDVSLSSASDRLEYQLKLRFPRPTRLGLRTPPFDEADGSLLGALCERPYIPGLVMLMPVTQGNGNPRYFADKPHSIQQVFRPSPRTWHTDRQDWWLGMSCFIGMNMATVEHRDGSKARQIGLLTRGIKHFFRWRRGGGESLGLSLGATIHHQMTQGFSVPKTSRFYAAMGRDNYMPYTDVSFLRAVGDYDFAFAIEPTRPGEAARRRLWRSAQEFALPAAAYPTDGSTPDHATGIACSPDSVVVTAMEPMGDELALRLTSFADRPTTATVRLPFDIQSATCDPPGGSVKVAGQSLQIALPAQAVRQIRLRRG